MNCCSNCENGVACASVSGFSAACTGVSGFGKAVTFNNMRYVNGVGGWFDSTIGYLGDFFGSSFGQAVLKVGATVGTAALSQSLFGDSGNADNQQVQSQNTSPTSPSSPVQSGNQSQPPQQIILANPPASQDYTMPIMIGVGILALTFVLTSRK